MGHRGATGTPVPRPVRPAFGNRSPCDVPPWNTSVRCTTTNRATHRRGTARTAGVRARRAGAGPGSGRRAARRRDRSAVDGRRPAETPEPGMPVERWPSAPGRRRAADLVDPAAVRRGHRTAPALRWPARVAGGSSRHDAPRRYWSAPGVPRVPGEALRERPLPTTAARVRRGFPRPRRAGCPVARKADARSNRPAGQRSPPVRGCRSRRRTIATTCACRPPGSTSARAAGSRLTTSGADARKARSPPGETRICADCITVTAYRCYLTILIGRMDHPPRAAVPAGPRGRRAAFASFNPDCIRANSKRSRRMLAMSSEGVVVAPGDILRPAARAVGAPVISGTRPGCIRRTPCGTGLFRRLHPGRTAA